GTEAFFAAHPTEPFFVKNLENVQGDERDVVFISVGYGRNPQGYMAMRFGPLSNDGGERRLNVLISRAKRRCEVFSSITADDIDLGRASGRGVAALKTFLSFAQTGQLGIATRTGRTEDSPFEEFVCDAVRNLGYEVHPQVGVAGFFIDLAVQDREKPGRYLLGIECDGAAYHSSRSARERDRLRQAVLEEHGWIIHRIWSTDWFQRPGEQIAKVAAAIERAKVVLAAAEDDARAAPVAHAVDVERDNAVVSVAEPDSLSVPYQQAAFAVPTLRAPHELTTPEMAQVVRRVVELEGPVHGDEVAVRIRELWGLGRTGSRIQESVSKALSLLVRRGECSEDDGFYSLPSAVIAIRNRGSASSASLRRPEYLPSAEVRAAVLLLIDTYHGAQRMQISTAVGRMLGFKATSAGLRARIDQQVAALVASGLLEVEGDEDGGDASVRRRAVAP
ncbi:MAG: DUF3320 domain-containing protein, partial [Planctomycetes bacterium]|nr:DUF3320 domain-containing protein [Planctomycetota bacterium]